LSSPLFAYRILAEVLTSDSRRLERAEMRGLWKGFHNPLSVVSLRGHEFAEGFEPGIEAVE
jgi:hypothetical protein